MNIHGQTRLKLLVIVAAFALQGCEMMNMGSYSDSDYDYDYNNYYDDRTGTYMETGGYYQRQHVTVPRSYHMSQGRTPTSHQQRDRNWVNSQNPAGYTIEVANDRKPSNVARQLHQAPKNQRKAQIKNQNGSQTNYTGVYGTYQDKAQAKEALKNLPPELRAKAGVKKWKNVQQNMDASPSKPRSLPNI